MKICSWNINSIRVRVNHLNLLIKTHKPDVILLQEIKCENHQFEEFFKSTDYDQIIKGQKGRHGVAILIKKNIDFETIKFNSKIINEEARICGVSLEKLSIINVYVPNGNPIDNDEKYSFKLRWMEELSKIVNGYISTYKNLVIGGDFNVLDNEKDVKDFKNWSSDALGKIETRKSFRRILSKGLFNVVRFFEEPGTHYSFWDYQKASWERNYGLLIDHFLVSPMILQCTSNILFEKKFRDLDKPSDHIPVIININN
ncbi:MAG: exodeoxyribonuclease III [Alphaproteobacteria bacterium]|nr:exodeoxyribonuclease III [Alphaproteobacteria bacterium]